MTVTELQAELDRLDDGVLLAGAHQAGGREFCALEFESQVRGREWSDVPLTLPDLRPINDALWVSDAERTEALLPVMAALWDWIEWTPKQQYQWVAQVIIETVRQIVAKLPGLPPDIVTQCRRVETLAAAEAAAGAAAEAAEVAWAARAAAGAAAGVAAEAAAEATAWAAEATNIPLITACHIWIAAAEHVTATRGA